jgi:hypothetical protein
VLPGPTLPASLAALLGALRPCFTAPSFATFCGLAAGLAGQARNRTRRAVERTVPFALLTSTLIITWSARHGHHRASITARRHAQPWYHAKTEPAFEDMLTQLRRVLIAARISKGSGAHPTPEQTQAVLAAWHAAAA